MRHQYECDKGRKDPATGRKIEPSLDEVRKIEKSTPFIKQGQLRIASQTDS